MRTDTFSYKPSYSDDNFLVVDELVDTDSQEHLYNKPRDFQIAICEGRVSADTINHNDWISDEDDNYKCIWNGNSEALTKNFTTAYVYDGTGYDPITDEQRANLKDANGKSITVGGKATILGWAGSPVSKTAGVIEEIRDDGQVLVGKLGRITRNGDQTKKLVGLEQISIVEDES